MEKSHFIQSSLKSFSILKVRIRLSLNLYGFLLSLILVKNIVELFLGIKSLVLVWSISNIFIGDTVVTVFGVLKFVSNKIINYLP